MRLLHPLFVRSFVGALAALLVLAGATVAHATPVAYTDQASFLAALASSSTLDFDSETAGSTIPSGGSVGGVTFTYALPGLAQLKVSDLFETPSSPNFLAADLYELLAAGDDFTMTFAATNAIGLYVISADAPNTFLFDGDLTLSAGGGNALLDVDAPELQLLDDAYVYFLGIVDPAATFTSASLTTNAGGLFFYNVDDIITGTAVPEPSSALLLGLGTAALAALRARSRA